MKRFVVVGTTGCGKTTLACRVSERLGIPHIELDALNWGPNWTPAPIPILRQRLADALTGETWVADGNYREVRDIMWGRATYIVWLDYPIWVVMARLARRTFQRIALSEELWSGNRERLRDQFFSRESLFLWALSTHWRRRREYPLLMSSPVYAHLSVVHLCSPRAADEWLNSLPRPPKG